MPTGDTVAVTLITKDSVNPFFIAMQEGAKAAAEKDNVNLTIAAGKADGDEDGQIQAIENAISRGDQGILIVPNGPGVNPAIVKARDAGLFVIALDTPPDPADTVDVTFATDNFKAGELIGKWTAGTLAGKPAVIALLDLFNDKVVSVDYNRDQGFLTGMGIDTVDKGKNGDEAATGNYSGGTYTIVCNEPTQGTQDGGKTAMENCLSKNPDINVVYSINEPVGAGRRVGVAVGRGDRCHHRLDRRWLLRREKRCGRHVRGDRPAVPAADGAVGCGCDHHHRPWRREAGCDTGFELLRHRRRVGHRQAGDGRRQHHLGGGRQDLLGLSNRQTVHFIRCVRSVRGPGTPQPFAARDTGPDRAGRR